MALISKKKKEAETIGSYEKREDLKKLCIYFTIVNFGQSASVLRIFQNLGVSAQYVQIGSGTATKQIMDILGMEDTRKEIVISFVKEESLEDIKKELDVFFVSNKKSKGIGFSVPLTSIVGVKMYSFLANSL